MISSSTLNESARRCDSLHRRQGDERVVEDESVGERVGEWVGFKMGPRLKMNVKSLRTGVSFGGDWRWRDYVKPCPGQRSWVDQPR